MPLIEERTKRYLLNRDGIGFFKAILESYEDVAIFSVIDGRAALIEVIYPAVFEGDLMGIAGDMVNYGIDLREVS